MANSFVNYAGKLVDIANDVLGDVDALVHRFVTDTYTIVVDDNIYILRTLFVLYVAIYGWSIMMRWTEASTKTASLHIFKMAFVFFAVTNFDVVTVYLFDVFIEGPDLFIKAISDATYLHSDLSIESAQDAINKILETGVGAGHQLALSIDSDLKSLGNTLHLMTFGLSGYALFLLLFARIGIAITLVLGALFFPLLLFKETRSYFFSWLKTLFYFALLLIVATGVLGLMVMLFADYIMDVLDAAGNQSLNFDQVAGYLVFTVVTALALTQVTAVAGALTGGGGGGAVGFFERFMPGVTGFGGRSGRSGVGGSSSGAQPSAVSNSAASRVPPHGNADPRTYKPS